MLEKALPLPGGLAVKTQRGAVLILVLWFTVLATLLVGVLSTEIRLSARAVAQYRQQADRWGSMQTALRAAEMELMLQRMPLPTEKSETPLNERSNPLLQFDGREQTLSYPIPPDIKVRIYDHAGLINLRRINIQQLRQLLEKQIGNDPTKINELQDAWQDWIDADELKRLNGAEKEYYKTLNPPYEPRNGIPETLEEYRLIKGFAEAFAKVEWETAFTIYGNMPGLNPNMATAEALALLPGLDAEAAQKIIARRQEKPVQNMQQLNEILTPEQMQGLASWINFGTGNHYTIAVERIEPETPDVATAKTEEKSATEAAPKRYAYQEIVLARGYAQPPKVLKIQPYGILPLAEPVKASQHPSTGSGNGLLDTRK